MRFLVAGAVNLETTVPVKGFPLHHRAVRFTADIRSAPSESG